MGNSGLSSLRTLVALPVVAAVATVTVVLLAPAGPSQALFHFAVIDEVMTGYGGSANVQFVEIKMLGAGQNQVANSVLAAFDTSGNYTGDVLIVPSSVANSGSGVRWIMGTSQFQTVSGLAPDFIMPAGLPTGGGMICWGARGFVPPVDTSWDRTNFLNYVDCVAYGTYSGPSNVHTGTATSLDADGHSLQRTQNTNSSAADFACGDPASPTNNAGSSASLAATVSCSPATATPAPTPTPTNTPTITPTPTSTPTPCPEGKVPADGGCGTPTATPTITLTPDCTDFDADTICDNIDVDDDNDGCTDVAELDPKSEAATGGGRDPLYYWDFMDMWVNKQKDRRVNIIDIGAIVNRFGGAGDPGGDPLDPPQDLTSYHVSADRSPPIGANLWNAGPPDGTINIIEIGLAVVQFGHNCN